MASIAASLLPPLLINGRKPIFSTLHMLPVPAIKERQNCVAVVVKATGESSESSLSLDIVKSVKNVAVDKLPFIPGALEFFGILYCSWFIYRYILFKPDREELFQIINKSISNVIGQ